jgi:hypothetical protein
MRAASAAPTTPSVTAALDVTVHQSDRKRAPGHLSHEGPELLRWALFEAAQQACRPASPDHEYYRQVAGRIDHNRACLSVARKLCRRAYHILRELGDEALAPVECDPHTEEAIAAACGVKKLESQLPPIWFWGAAIRFVCFCGRLAAACVPRWWRDVRRRRASRSSPGDGPA